MHKILASLSLCALALPVHVHASGIDTTLCGSPKAEVSGTSGNFTSFSQELSSPSCYAYVSTTSGPGYGSAVASVNWSLSGSSGYLSASGATGFSESVHVSVPDDATGSVVFRPHLKISLDAPSANAQFGSASAAVTYSATFEQTISGAFSIDSSGAINSFGQWNQVLILPEVVLFAGVDYPINVAASVYAEVNKTFQPGITTTGSAIADFSHTLRWMGGEVIRVYDNQQNEIAPPANFYIQLIGQSSGIDYALAVPVPVPEPETYAFLAVGLGLVSLMARRKKMILR